MQGANLLCTIAQKGTDNNYNVMRKALVISLLMLATKASAGPVSHVTLTCYQPTKEQCDDTPTTTADGSKINMKHLKQGKIKWCAISKDLLYLFPKGKPKRIWIEGHGIYEVRDTMNPRHTHRVDILIHPSDKTRFCKEKVKIKIL